MKSNKQNEKPIVTDTDCKKENRRIKKRKKEMEAVMNKMEFRVSYSMIKRLTDILEDIEKGELILAD